MLQSPGQAGVGQQGDGHVGERPQSNQGDFTWVILPVSSRIKLALIQKYHLGYPGENTPGFLLVDSGDVRFVVKGDIIESILSMISVRVVVRHHHGLLGSCVYRDVSTAGTI